MIRSALTALALTTGLILAPPALAADKVPPIQFQSRTLANGLQVLTSVDRTTPNVTVQVWYGVGSKDDPQGRSGFAHLFEHMMFKATRDLPSESIDRMTEDVGGNNNASTYDDFTNYYEVVPAHHLERLIWVESQRLGSLVVDEATFKSERDVVKEELRQRILASPYGRLFGLYLPQATYQVHPYKRPGIGSIEELDAATIDDVRAFHRAYYRPDNAALIVVGNFDEAQLQAWVDKYMAPLTAPAEPIVRVTAREPARTASGVFEGYGPNVPLPAVAITWLGASASDPDAPALTLLDAILSSGKSARLYDSLVYDQQIAADIFSSADMPQQPGMIVVGAIMSQGKSLDQGEAALLKEVARLRDAPPSAAELSEAKNELIAGKLRERETIDGRAFALGYALRTSGDPADANGDIAALQAVTPDQVQAVARKYLSEASRMTIRYQAESERKGPAPAPLAAVIPASVPYRGPVVTLAPEGQRMAPPPVGTPVEPVLPTPVEKTLKNGLRVIVAQSSRLPLVSADLTLRVGAFADPEGRAGTASLTAGMLTEGTTTRSAQDIARQTEAMGANLSADAGQEFASVSLNVMPGSLKKAMGLMADVARNPAFAKEELERQRSQTLDGLSVAYQSPGQISAFALSPILYGNTPFGHVAGGTPASVEKIQVSDLSAIHQTWFRPDNAILVISGDISPRAAFRLAQKAFGDWKAPTAALPKAPTITASSNPRQVVVDLAGTGQASVSVAKVAIPRTAPDYFQGLVTNALLGGGYSARLNQEIRIKRGLSYGAGSRLTALSSTGSFRAQAQTKNESAAQVLDLIHNEIAGLGKNPAPEAELTARKSGLIGDYGRALATTEGVANILGNLAAFGLPLSDMSTYTGKVAAVSPDQVQSFAKTHLDPAQMNVIIVGDAKSFAADLKARLPDLETIGADQLDLDRADLTKPKD